MVLELGDREVGLGAEILRIGQRPTRELQGKFLKLWVLFLVKSAFFNFCVAELYSNLERVLQGSCTFEY